MLGKCRLVKKLVGDHNTLLYKQGYTEDTIKELAKNACHHFADRRYYKINNIPLFHIHELIRLILLDLNKYS